MICDICNKEPATVHLTEIVDDQIMELHLCEECAREKGAQMEQHFGLADLLAGLADLGKQFPETTSQIRECAHCGLKYEDFKRIGRLGCGECYESFKKSLELLLRRIQGSTRHIGKSPKGKTVPKTKLEIRELKVRLKQAVELEEFEEAVRLRDKIKELEQKKRDTK